MDGPCPLLEGRVRGVLEQVIAKFWTNILTFSVSLSKRGKQEKVFKFAHSLSTFCYSQRHMIKRDRF